MIKRTRKGHLNINATVASEMRYHLKTYGKFNAYEIVDAINNQLGNESNEQVTISQVRSRISKAADFGINLNRVGSYYYNNS